MSGDHNMNQTDSGWRKRQIALDKKAENARELGLDYEPDKTIMDMAREVNAVFDVMAMGRHDGTLFTSKELEAFAKLVRAAERDECCAIVYGQCESDNVAQRTVDAIRKRGQA
jgi:hypothetical protein